MSHSWVTVTGIFKLYLKQQKQLQIIFAAHNRLIRSISYKASDPWFRTSFKSFNGTRNKTIAMNHTEISER